MESIKSLLQRNKKAVIVVLVLLIALGIFLLLGSSPKGFRIVVTNPRLNEVTSFAPFIKLHLNESIASRDNVSIASQPIVKSYEVSDKTITIFLNALDKGKRYTITIDSIQSTQGNFIKNHKLTFTAKEGNWDKLPEDQKEAILKEQDEKPAASTDPILVYLPHETPEYIMSALYDSDGLRILVKITPAFADTLADGSMDPQTYEQYKKQALDYIRSLNFDPANYKIEFDTVSPYPPEQI